MIDTRPVPAPIADLADDPAGPMCAITLRWTAPATDMAASGPDTVAAYDVRYSMDPITEENFYDQPALVPPSPLAPGEAQTLIVEGIGSDAPHWFAVKSIGAAGARSVLSNVVVATRVQAVARVPTRPGRPVENACGGHAPGVGSR